MSISDIKIKRGDTSSVSREAVTVEMDDKFRVQGTDSTASTDIDSDNKFIKELETSLEKQQYKSKLDEYFYKRLIDLDKKLIKIDSEFATKMMEFDTKLAENTNRGLESLGIFAAVLALIIINVKVIESANTFLSAMLLITTLALVLMIFTAMIHYFLSPNRRDCLGKFFWIPIAILSALLVLGIVTHVVGIEIYNVVRSNKKDIVNVNPVAKINNNAKTLSK